MKQAQGFVAGTSGLTHCAAISEQINDNRVSPKMYHNTHTLLLQKIRQDATS